MRISFTAVLIAVATFLAVAGAAPAGATPLGTDGQKCVGFQQSPSGDFSQDACTVYSRSGFDGRGPGLYGYSAVALGEQVAVTHVVSCDMTASLVASYGTVHTLHWNCLAALRRTVPGGLFSNPLSAFYFGTGAGGVSDGYSLHPCLTIRTGVTYTNCPQGQHPSTPYIFPWANGGGA